MMEDMRPTEGEFAEFETTESQIDAMMATGEPVEVVVPGERSHVDALYERVRPTDLTWGGSTVIPQVGNVAPSVKVSGPVMIPSGAAA